MPFIVDPDAAIEELQGQVADLEKFKAEVEDLLPELALELTRLQDETPERIELLRTAHIKAMRGFAGMADNLRARVRALELGEDSNG